MSPFNLYQSNKYEFIHKVCAVCLDALFFPEQGETMIPCVQYNCKHIYHANCVRGVNRCPECRGSTDKIISTVNASIELAIRSDAFDNNEVNDELKCTFSQNRLVVADYPYHKSVFLRWQTLKKNQPC